MTLPKFNAEYVSNLFLYDETTGKLKATDDNHMRNTDGFMFRGNLVLRLATKHYKYADLVWAVVMGEWPKGKLSFKDGDPTNTRFENLEDEKPYVAPAPRTYRGVVQTSQSTFKGQWRVKDERGRPYVKYLGSYRTAELASEAVEKFLKENKIQTETPLHPNQEPTPLQKANAAYQARNSA
jgi:hypothetical protein